jgi:hypothetical protein
VCDADEDDKEVEGGDGVDDHSPVPQQELKELQVAAGRVDKSALERLDWMYEGPLATMTDHQVGVMMEMLLVSMVMMMVKMISAVNLTMIV